MKYFTLEEIGEMERTDFDDWSAAVKAKELNDQLELINIMSFAHPVSKKDMPKRSAKFNSIQNKKFMLLGHNPFKADEKKIEDSWKKVQSKKVTKKDGSDN